MTKILQKCLRVENINKGFFNDKQFDHKQVARDLKVLFPKVMFFL